MTNLKETFNIWYNEVQPLIVKRVQEWVQIDLNVDCTDDDIFIRFKYNTDIEVFINYTYGRDMIDFGTKDFLMSEEEWQNELNLLKAEKEAKRLKAREWYAELDKQRELEELARLKAKYETN